MNISKAEFVKRCSNNMGLMEVLQEMKCENQFFRNIMKVERTSYPDSFAPEDIIRVAFPWGATPEGIDFWAHVDSRLMLVFGKTQFDIPF